MAIKHNGKTAREWLIIFAAHDMHLYGVSAHIALEEAYADGVQNGVDISNSRFAASAYAGISQKRLERLIKAVEDRHNRKRRM